MSKGPAHERDILALVPPPSPAPAIESTEAFNLAVPPSPGWQIVDFRFFPPKAAARAVPRPGEVCVKLPTGSVLLVSYRPQVGSGARSASS